MNIYTSVVKEIKRRRRERRRKSMWEKAREEKMMTEETREVGRYKYTCKINQEKHDNDKRK